MSLYTGNRIHGYTWDALPIDNKITRRVEELATNDCHNIRNRHHIFEQLLGHEIINKEEFISNKNQILEYEDEEEILNSNNEEIEGENMEIDNTEYGIYITDTEYTED